MITQRVLGHWTHRNISGAFDRWSVFTREHKSHLQKANKVLRHWLNQTLAMAFEQWHHSSTILAKQAEVFDRVRTIAMSPWTSYATVLTFPHCLLDRT